MTDLGSMLEFPCTFPLKVMGKNSEKFFETVQEIVRRHVPEVTDEDFRSRLSSRDKYLAITVTFMAKSRAQVETIYEELNAHELVLMTL